MELRTVESLCDAVYSGGTPSRKKPEYYEGGTIPWIKTMEIRDGYIYDSEEKITESGLQNSSAKFVPKESVLIAMYGATVGRVGYLKIDSTTNQAACALVVDSEITNPKWLYYSILATRDSLIDKANGAAQQNISVSIVRNHQIKYVPLEEQERIAGILGSLDDKIEANTRLIQTLEGYIHAMIAKISKSDSLKRVAIKDLAIHEKNQELPREHVEGAIHHYSLPAYDSGKTPGVEEADSIKSNKFIIDKPCVLFSKLNPGTPRIWLVNPEDGVKSYASTEFIVLTPNENVDIANLWAACSEERISQNLADMASGTSTSHQRVRPADILNSKVLDLNDQSEIRSITSYIEALRKENLQLAETRDALIMRLIG